MSEETEPAFEVQMHSDMGRAAHPAFNIKVRQGPDSVTFPIEIGLVKDVGETEFRTISTDPAFTLEWIEENVSASDQQAIWDDTCQDHYDWVKEQADEVFSADVIISQEGRSGGWMVVEGLPENIEDWDSELRRQWTAFGETVKAAVEDVPRAYLTSIYANEFENRESAETTFTVKVDGESIHLMDGENEIVMWDQQEWVEDPALVLAIANAIDIGHREGPDGLRARLAEGGN